MQVTLNVRRYDPDSDQPVPYDQEYSMDVDENATVLDGLIKVREEVDGSLALRCSCRSAICGSCSMRVNGQAILACNTKLTDVVLEGGRVDIEPAGNMGLIKDLVVEFDIFWDKVRAVEPWLQPEGEEPESEYIAPNDDMVHLAGVMGCIMCGACVSDCTVLEVDRNFLGPAALAKSYRFVAAPRDDADESRLDELNESGGVWDCTRCMMCVEVCPKGVDPMGRIMSLREKVIDAGHTETYGARHAEAFTRMVRHSGRVDELQLPIQTFGMFNVKEMIKLIPVGVRSQLAGKLPPIMHQKNPGMSNVRRIFNRVEDKR